MSARYREFETAGGAWLPAVLATSAPKLYRSMEEATQGYKGETSPHLWLVAAIAIVATLATLAWWGWWFERYRAAKLGETELAYRRLARLMGLTRADRELLRRLSEAQGVHPLAAIASPKMAMHVTEDAAPSRSLRRVVRLLCEPGPEPSGTTEQAPGTIGSLARSRA